MSEMRKRKYKSMEQRLQALERLDKGESVQSICKDLNVGKSTVNDWRRNRKSIEGFCTQIDTEKVLEKRCTLRKAKHELVEDALWLWFVQERRRGTPLSGPILKEKAMILHSKLQPEEAFVASDGWLSRWKKRHGVHFIGVCGEKLSANPTAATDFSARFLKIIDDENFCPEQIYNIDETGLSFKLLPRKTFATPQETSAPGFKTSKDRITVALCSNASGTHKLPLFVIGKAAKPRAFKNINMDALPVYYRSQKSAWMDTYLFREWFVCEFVPKVKKHLAKSKLPAKALLLLDNAPTHDEHLQCDDEKEIKLLFLPPNVTSLQQPMDQGVIECFKRKYRRKLLSEVLSKLETDDSLDLTKVLKSVNMKDVVYMSAKAYDEIPPSTFVKSWKKLWPNIEDSVDQNNTTADEPNNILDGEPDDNAALLHDLQQLPNCGPIVEEDVLEWINMEKELDNEVLNDDEIVECVIRQDNEMNNDADGAEIEEEDEENKMSHAEGKAALQLAATYIEQQKEATAVDVIFIKKWREFAHKKSLETKIQKKVTDYFKC
uniref:HTH CENPB-type domain-containing protein n=1 Tax=Homalodisca liturata TaxID=320908 RepID=A0A1B6JVI3_9HEMI